MKDFHASRVYLVNGGEKHLSVNPPFHFSMFEFHQKKRKHRIGNVF